MAFPRPRDLTPVPLADLAAVVGSTPPPGPPVEVGGVTLDSRSIQPGDLYAALPGARFHGAEFLPAVRDAGAVAVLTDPAGAARAAAVGLPALVVPDPRAVLGDLAARVYATVPPGLRLIGITGTNGKTTTAYLIDSALHALGHRVGLIGTVETRIGPDRIKSVRTTPESPDVHALVAVMRERRCDACVMEVSSHALTLHRVDGLVYDLALFTNLSQDHLDHHGTMAGYFAAKAALFTPERARRGLVCIDDEWGRRLAREAGIPIVTLASVGPVDAADGDRADGDRADGDRADGDREVANAAEATYVLRGDASDPMRFSLSGAGLHLRLRSALPGTFNQINTALAALALILTGIPPEEAGRAVLADPHVPGRMERVSPADGDLLAVVDYAHTPEAVGAALAALRPQVTGERALVAVLGAGGSRDTGKRPAMGAAAVLGADIVVVTDDNPRDEDAAAIRAAVLAGARAAVSTGARATDIVEVADRGEAIRTAVAMAIAVGTGSVVAVLGKGHESGQEIAGQVHHFDDREELRRALGLPDPAGVGA